MNKSGSSREAAIAAESMGYYTVVLTNREKQIIQRDEYSEVHQLTYVDFRYVDEVKKQIQLLQQRGHEISCICSFVDQYVELASRLADEFCSNPLSTDAISIMEDKEKTRTFFSNQPYTPSHIFLEKGMSVDDFKLPEYINLPVMVKSSKSTGSKDVIFANDLTEMVNNIKFLRKKHPDETIIIEEYIEGEQYLVEVLVHQGEVNLVAIIRQEITQGKRFIITGYGVMAQVPSSLKRSILEIVVSITDSLNINNGAFHLEIRKSGDGCKLIEINPRISGGAMNQMIYAAFGFSLVEQTLKMLVGDVPNLSPKSNFFVFTQHIILDHKGKLEKVTGKNKAMLCPDVVEVFIKPRRGALITPPASMGDRYAYVIARGETMEKARLNAKRAAAKIGFHLIDIPSSKTIME